MATPIAPPPQITMRRPMPSLCQDRQSPSSRAEPPEGRRSRGTSFVGAPAKKVPPLRLAARGSGRDDDKTVDRVNRSSMSTDSLSQAEIGALREIAGTMVPADAGFGMPGADD